MNQVPQTHSRLPRLLGLALAAVLSSSTPRQPELTAAQAAAHHGQYVHVHATVAATRTTRTGYTFISLDHARPGCKLEVVMKPELTNKLSTAPSKLAGRLVVVQGYVQATANGSTAQIWLDRAPALSVAPL